MKTPFLFAILAVASAVQRTDVSGRILDGELAEVGEFPDIVSIHTAASPIGLNHYCTGVLVHPEWVLSAGRCLVGGFSVTAGVTVRTLAGIATSQIIEAAEIRLHPGYCSTCVAYPSNIGLVRLSTPVNMNGIDVALARLPEQGAEWEGRTCTMAGWGRTSTQIQLSPELRKAEVEVMERGECESMIASLEDPDFFIYPYTDCTYNGVNGLCDTDEGGPLYCLVDEEDPSEGYYVAGIASWFVPTLLGQCRADMPSVFTNTANFREWIDGIINP